MGAPKIYTCPTISLGQFKLGQFKLMTKNVPLKITIYLEKNTILNTFISMINFHSCFMFNTYNFHWFIIKFIQFMIYETKRKYWIWCIVSRWLHHGCFHLLKTKSISSFSPFALTYAPLLKIFWIMLKYSYEI